jgi:hypothetical protein
MALAFSETGTVWTEIWKNAQGGNTKASVPLGSHFHNHDVGFPTYGYYLKLTLDGQITALKFQSDIQVAPASLPALEAGENNIRYLDDAPGPRAVDVTFGYR